MCAVLLSVLPLSAQQSAAPATAAPASSANAPAAQVTAQAAPAATAQGGTIQGTVVAGTADKPGGIPLPGVAVTAKNTLTGKQYTTTTDIDGAYAMTIPKNGRYVVRVELAGFAAETHEVVLNGGAVAAAKDADFGMGLASRVAAAEARQATAATTLARGVQGLNLSTDGTDAADATASAGNADAAMPTLSNLSDNVTGAAASQGEDAIAVSGQTEQTNALAGFSEDEIRQRVEDAVAAGRANGSIPQGGDPTNAIVSMLGGMMGGPGGGFGSRRGSRGGPGGSGAFRNFNPAQPHGSIFYQGGNSALNSAQWSPSLLPVANPSAYSNRFGASFAGSPYIPGLTKPNTKQFVFINLNGQKNLNAFLATGRVPTALERAGNFSQSTLGPVSNAIPVAVYNPATGMQFPNNTINVPLSMAAQKALAYYPAPNIPLNAQGYNYQTISNAGNNNVSLNTRYVRTLGNGPGMAGFSRGGGRGSSTGPPVLRQNINIGYNFSHSAADQRNIFLPLGGANESDGNGLTVGYTVSYGRLSNNASVNWNRLNAETRNYFTDTGTDPTATVGLNVPNLTGGFADSRFYNGLATFNISNFQTLANTTPSRTINQTISYSDFIAYRHKHHNIRTGFDIRRVHADSIGGNNPLGSYTFTGYATASPTDQLVGNGGLTSGDGFADFLLGLPTSTSIQAGLYKDYLRENVYDGYFTDDWRARSNLTLNYGMRYDYYAPYTEKNGRLVNLTGVTSSGINGTTGVGCVSPDGVTYKSPGGTMVNCGASPQSSLVNPDRTMFSPRFGLAWKPTTKIKQLGDVVVRAGYGINYNTGQYATFARLLSHQTPFATTQNNDVPTPTRTNPTPTATGCTTLTPTTPNPTLSLAQGFGCSTLETINNNWAVDNNYRLGMVQVYNVNIQKTLPLQIVMNIGYNGSKGSGLDVVGSPNASPSGVTTQSIAPFDFEESLAESRSNQLVVSMQQRQQKGIALGFVYTYSHTIDNASGVGGAVGTPIQNFYNLAAEEGNSSFDQRHNFAGNWLLELPFGPNRHFFNKGGVTSHLVDGFSLSGTFTFATGTYYTPEYSGNQSEASSGNTFIQRPDRVASQPLKGPGKVGEFFNIAAFAAPAATYGTASQGSIEGPGTVSVNASLSRTVQLGGTNSFEARVTASNVFNTVQYNNINVIENNANFGEVTSAATMRALQVQARYRF
jgi:hypothetical protein